MILYAILTLLMGLLLIKKIRSKKLGIITFCILFILSAFRGENVGTDTDTYLSNYYNENRAFGNPSLYNLTVLDDFDFGNLLELTSNTISAFVIFNNLNTRFVIIFYSFVMLLFLYLSFKKTSVPLIYGLALFVILGYYPLSMNICRQLCAISVLLYAYILLMNNEKWYKFLLTIIFATSIHSFSIIFGFLYFVKYIPYIGKKISIVILLLCYFFCIVKVDFIQQLSLLADTDHGTYLFDTYGDEAVSLKKIISSLIKISLSFYFYAMSKKYHIINNVYLQNLYLLSILFFSLFVNYSGILGRITYNIQIVECIFIALYLIKCNPNLKALQNNNMVILILLTIYYMYTNFRFFGIDETQYYFGF